MIELRVSGLAGRAGGVDGDARHCLWQVVSASFGAAEGLRSGKTQDIMGISVAFRDAAIYGCLSNEQVAFVTGTDVAVFASSTECFRHLYTQEFPKLYNDLGPKIFGSSLDLSTEEHEIIDAFLQRRAECRTSPAAVYPTPSVPAPMLLPRVRTATPSAVSSTELWSTIDTNAAVRDFLSILGENDADCLRTEFQHHWRNQESGYEDFLSLPVVVLTSLPLTLDDCLGNRAGRVMENIIAAPAGGLSIETQTCFGREFSETENNYEDQPPRLPAWRLTPGYFRCLTTKNYQNLAIAQLAAYVGELSADSENCARGIAAEGYHIAGRIDKDVRAISPLFDISAHVLCLSEGEFAELYPEPPAGIELRWPPNDRECTRAFYDKALNRLRIEINDIDWHTDESGAYKDFWSDVRNCVVQP